MNFDFESILVLSFDDCNSDENFSLKVASLVLELQLFTVKLLSSPMFCKYRTSALYINWNWSIPL